MHTKQVIFIHKKAKTLDILLEFLIGCVKCGLCSTSVYCASFYM